jgi:hypothetical protein
MRNIVRPVHVLILCGTACIIDPGGSPFCQNVPMNQATGTIRITQEVGAAQAAAAASFEHGACTQTLEDGQEVAINGQLLSGPDEEDAYAATIPTGSSVTTFTVLVNEPTRGVSQTDIALPAAFDVTAPVSGGAISLSGTTFTWSNADPGLDVRITIRQNLFGELRERAYGPFDDTGSVRLSVTDLSTFAQGADVTITVARTRETSVVNGLQSGTLTAELTRTFTAVPAP